MLTYITEALTRNSPRLTPGSENGSFKLLIEIMEPEMALNAESPVWLLRRMCQRTPDDRL